MKVQISQERLVELLEYNKETGIFTWKERLVDSFKKINAGKIWNKRFANKNTGCIDKSNGYLRINIEGKLYLAHRLAWIYVNGCITKEIIDHVNGNITDNRISNLREASKSENLQNRRLCQSNNKSSGLLGVSYDKKFGSFFAQIIINGRKKFLGYFDTKEDAYDRYLQEKRILHPYGML